MEQIPPYEEVAAEVRKAAKLADDRIELAITIARRVLGPGSVVEIPRFSTTGLYTTVNGEPRIFVRKGAQDLNFIVAHELAHWALHAIAFYEGSLEQEEDLANRIGAAIIAPQRMVIAAYRQHGDRVSKIAPIFDCTQSSAWLRLGEALGDERVLVAGDHVRIRSFGAYPWDESSVRMWARGRAPHGIRKAILRSGYDCGRVAMKFEPRKKVG